MTHTEKVAYFQRGQAVPVERSEIPLFQSLFPDLFIGHAVATSGEQAYCVARTEDAARAGAEFLEHSLLIDLFRRHADA